jgi:hypothetical protein
MLPPNLKEGGRIMSKKFKFKAGHVGVVSDKVAEILEKKGEGKILGDKEPEPKKSEGK